MTETVLVVDDEEDLRFLLRLELEAEGYEVLEAVTGTEALATIEHTSVSLVMLDVSLPDIDGFEVLAELGRRGALPGLRVIMVSAHTDDDRVKRALGAGSCGYLRKPFRASELWAAVRPGF